MIFARLFIAFPAVALLTVLATIFVLASAMVYVMAASLTWTSARLVDLTFLMHRAAWGVARAFAKPDQPQPGDNVVAGPWS